MMRAPLSTAHLMPAAMPSSLPLPRAAENFHRHDARAPRMLTDATPVVRLGGRYARCVSAVAVVVV